MRSLLLLLLLAGTVAAADAVKGEYAFSVQVPRPDRGGKPQPPAVGRLWLPDGDGPIRGLLLAGKTLLEGRLCRDAAIRAACAEKRMGVLYFEPALAALFDYAKRDCGGELLAALRQLAETSRRPEVEHVPWLTIGHSTGGIFCRNVAFWKPERVIGVLHLKSGNFQDHVQDASKTIAGVPFLAINGEFEEFGPAGGDLKMGLRSAYSLAADKTKQNQTQWVMIRMQILERRRRNPDNLMSLVVHRGGNHTGWDAKLTALTCQFIRSCADARIPAAAAAGAPVACTPLRAAGGWLSDADIKDPKHAPAPFAGYAGDKARAFWHVDEAMAKAVAEYHAGPWTVPDPTAGQADAERFAPPPPLRDAVDGGG